jgi:hypothetical protein
VPVVDAGGSMLILRRKKVGKKATVMLGRGLFRFSTGVTWYRDAFSVKQEPPNSSEIEKRGLYFQSRDVTSVPP